jgi:hypothetical protein
MPWADSPRRQWYRSTTTTGQGRTVKSAIRDHANAFPDRSPQEAHPPFRRDRDRLTKTNTTTAMMTTSTMIPKGAFGCPLEEARAIAVIACRVMGVLLTSDVTTGHREGRKGRSRHEIRELWEEG